MEDQKKRNKNQNFKIMTGEYNDEGEFSGVGSCENEPDLNFIGDFIDNKKEGHGMFFKNEFVCCGRYKDDYLNGIAYIKDLKPELLAYPYEGTMLDFSPHGFGKEVYDDNSIYYGEFANGETNGFGMIVKDNIIAYSGTTNNGDISGNGVINYGNNGFFIGEVKDGEENGYGVRTIKNEIYKGEFVNGMPHGKGRSIIIHKGVFLHEISSHKRFDFEEETHSFFNNNKFFTKQELLYYKGGFQNGLYHGFGDLKTTHGVKYSGQFKNGKYHGFGNYLDPFLKYSGYFSDGKMNGNGKIKFVNGESYKGEFEDGKYHGVGTLKINKKKKFKGDFFYNTFIEDGKYRVVSDFMHNGFEDNLGVFEDENEEVNISNPNIEDVKEILQEEINEKLFLFIDTETTGLPETDENVSLVELAFILTTESNRIICYGSFLVKPDGFKISDEISELINITNEEAIENGFELEDVISFAVELTSLVTVIIGHNIDYDIEVLESELNNTTDKLYFNFYDKKIICTMKESTDFCQIKSFNYKYKWPKLEELYLTIFGVVPEFDHRALADTVSTMECFWELVNKDIIQPPS